jgi:D-3-phosphoglycerate dehydrogenase / 2-oxoglutarate reductase
MLNSSSQISHTKNSAEKNVLITDRFSQEAFLTLSQQNYLKVKKTEHYDITFEDLSNVEALIIRSRTKITSELLQKTPKLQLIITATSGFDHIDLNACAEWGITVMFTPEANRESAAQLTWSLLLNCAQKVLTAHKSVKAGEWRRDALTGTELYKKTYGVVGLGRIGSRVAEIAQVFGLNVIAYDPFIEEKVFRQNQVERVSFEELLKSSDVISFHVPATVETHHMLTRSQFENINRGVILINTSRGSVISEQDLCEALEKNWVGAVGLDVYEKEPLPRNSKLMQFENVVLTPHIGANTQEAFQKASEQAALKLIQFFIDGSTSDTLPPKAAWYGAPPPFPDR